MKFGCAASNGATNSSKVSNFIEKNYSSAILDSL
jgi:hypothetical protein